MEVVPKDGDKKSFTCHDRIFCFTKITFSLTNSAEIFKRAIDILLSTVPRKCPVFSLDSITFFSTYSYDDMTYIG